MTIPLLNVLSCILLLLIMFSPVVASEWSEIKETVGGKSLQITDNEVKIRLIWHTTFVPGEEILIVKHSFADESYYSYEFQGVVDGSLQLKIIGPSDGTSRRSTRIENTIFVDDNGKGIFYLVPALLKNDASFKIERDTANPGFYKMEIVKRQVP